MPPETRAAFAISLLESLDDTFDADVEMAWEMEIAQRVKELDLVRLGPVPWPEARRAIAGEWMSRETVEFHPEAVAGVCYLLQRLTYSVIYLEHGSIM